MTVIYLPKVRKYFENLVPLLYEQGYFSYKESAQKYVDDLFDNISGNLPTRLHKPAPKYFDKYGKSMKYAIFKKNKNTSWYAFFKTYEMNGERIFLVRYVGNNHVVAQHLTGD